MNETFNWTSDRRRSPRVDLLAVLQGHVVTLDEQVGVRQLSLLGMTVETTAPLSPRLQHDFRISFGSSATTVHGRVVHSRVVVEGDRVTYLAGVEFVDISAEALESIGRIIDDVSPSTE